MQYSTSLLAISGLISMVSAHGYITSPAARKPGTEFAKKCSQQLYYQQSSDINGNVQGELQVATGQSDYNSAECNLWLCKGFQFADNTANVQTYTAGQSVPIKVNIAAPHTGTANVTIYDTKTGQPISDVLKSWDVYASNSVPIQDGDENFSVTMPDLGSKCSTAGDCVIQWIWDAHSISQTYQACIDFTMGGSGSGSSSAASSAATSTAVASSAAVSSKVAATSAPASSAAATSAVVTSSTAPVVSSAVVSSTAAVVSSAVSDAATPTVYVTVTVTPSATCDVGVRDLGPQTYSRGASSSRRASRLPSTFLTAIATPTPVATPPSTPTPVTTPVTSAPASDSTSFNLGEWFEGIIAAYLASKSQTAA